MPVASEPISIPNSRQAVASLPMLSALTELKGMDEKRMKKVRKIHKILRFDKSIAS